MADLNDFACLIPARRNSKGILNKNRKKIGPLELYQWSVRHAKLAGFKNDRIFVSTDDPEIIDYCISNNISYILRSIETSTDTASTESVMLESLNYMPPIKHLITLQPTSPLRFDNLVSRCIYAYLSDTYDSLITVSKLYNFLWKKDASTHSYVSTYNIQKRPRRQDLTEYDYVFFDNGNVYISNIEMLKEKQCRIGSKPCLFSISFFESFQIDSIKDLEIVEKIVQNGILFC